MILMRNSSVKEFHSYKYLTSSLSYLQEEWFPNSITKPSKISNSFFNKVKTNKLKESKTFRPNKNLSVKKSLSNKSKSNKKSNKLRLNKNKNSSNNVLSSQTLKKEALAEPLDSF